MIEVIEVIKNIGIISSAIITLAACLTLLIKPLRNQVFGIGLIKEGLKCLLRNEITLVYYKNNEKCELRQYEYENVCRLYKAYKRLKGNSFVDKIFDEMENLWKVV